MESKIEIFFGKFAIYIIGVLAFAVTVTGVGWYVTGYELDAAKAQAKTTETQLAVSNASYGSIKDQFSLLTQKLEANQERALASHALLQEKLSTIVESDKSREALEASLLSRTPEGQCVTPKDLSDAWNKL